jgi:hypothetical protein
MMNINKRMMKRLYKGLFNGIDPLQSRARFADRIEQVSFNLGGRRVVAIEIEQTDCSGDWGRYIAECPATVVHVNAFLNRLRGDEGEGVVRWQFNEGDAS